MTEVDKDKLNFMLGCLQRGIEQRKIQNDGTPLTFTGLFDISGKKGYDLVVKEFTDLLKDDVIINHKITLTNYNNRVGVDVAMFFDKASFDTTCSVCQRW